jgi:hypothetical protein
MIKARKINSENEELIFFLQEILSFEGLENENIIKILDGESLEDEAFKLAIETDLKLDKNKKELIKRLERDINREKTDDLRKVNARKRKIYLEKLEECEVLCEKEKQMVVILDNYRVHHSKLLKKACNFLNIVLIYLPPYSPKLNPIEQVWRTIKNELSSEFIIDKNFLKDKFESLFYNFVDNPSFTDKWILKFFINAKDEILMDEMCLMSYMPEL